MKKLILFICMNLLAINTYSAYLQNIPIELKQPDGTVVSCFVTGDEFHRRVHDKDNYTIIQNPKTEYYVYAQKIGEELVLSDYIVGKSDPKQLQLEPNLDIPARQMEEKRKETLKSAKVIANNSTKGDFNNIVISIRFSDQNPTPLSYLDYENKFNSSTTLSLKTYYKEVSNSQFNVSSSFYPQPQNQTVLEYQDSHPRAYYTEYNAIDNPIGYKAGEDYDREQNLIKNAIAYVTTQLEASQVNFDMNNDGSIDNLIFIIQGNVDIWGKILWPSSTSLGGSAIFIGNKVVNRYNKQFSSILNVGVLSHEFFHSLGAPDLYRYYNTVIDPVGSWDLMGTTGTQHMTTYMKCKYGKWFDTIPEITQPGNYTLQPISKTPFACYKIASPVSSNEYFIVEYRKKEGLLENAIPGYYNDGLIIYRINTTIWGNSDGPPDELYVYRVDGDTTRNGDISKAAFSANFNRTVFNNETNPSCFLSNGDRSGIVISNVSSVGNTISFYVNQNNRPPTANSGIDKTVNEGTIVTLDGTGSTDLDGDALTYKWTAPEGITLSSSTSAKPTFATPKVTSDSQITFTLVVNDGTVDSQPDSVSFLIKNINIIDTVTDIDGNTYHTVTIGTQTWMVENLKTTKYRNGDLIGTTIPATKDISGESTPKYQWAYNGDESNAAKYGRLYTWYTVTDSRNIAPLGWHVPIDAEWTTLTEYLTNNGFGYDGSGDDIAKSMAATSGWAGSTEGTPGYNQESNNSSCFAGLPCGIRDISGVFPNMGTSTYWWSFSENDTSLAWSRSLRYYQGNAIRNSFYKRYGFSVRCILGESPTILIPTLRTRTAMHITLTSATCNGIITNDGGAPVTARGFCWNKTGSPTTNDYIITQGIGMGDFTSNLTDLTANTTYYVKAYATNSVGTAYGNEISFTTHLNSVETVTDIDGNVYHSIKIGTQTWMVENLKTTRYRNGDPIPNITDNTAWSNLTTGAYCNYSNSADLSTIYGRLYNWYAVADTRNIAPTGWHIPTDAEWTILTDYLTNNGYGYDGSGDDIAKSMAATSGWPEGFSTEAGVPGYDQASNNSSGFSALPGGCRRENGDFDNWSLFGYWWSATETSLTNAWYRGVGCDYGELFRYSTFNNYGFSVRCIKDEIDPRIEVPVVNTTGIYDITTTAAKVNVNISSDGGSPVIEKGVCWNISGSPTTSENKTVDGAGTGRFTSNLTGLSPNTLYYVRSYATNSIGTSYGDELYLKTYTNTVTDIDGNVYYTVIIGTQTWMAENLKTTHYRNKDSIPNITDNKAWANVSTGAYCNYNNNKDIAKKYGKLYNWYAIADSRNIAPMGWHVPTDAEWKVLTDYLVSTGYERYEYADYFLGKSLAASSIWNGSQYPGTIGFEVNKNNISGFTGLPGGMRYCGNTYVDDGSFWYIGGTGFWWLLNECSTACTFKGLLDANGMWLILDFDKHFGFSVRCVKDTNQINRPPVANAGIDQTGYERTTVTLDGTYSFDLDGDNLTYKWTSPAGITLSSTTVVKPTFIAPEVKKDSILSFYLTVKDGFENSASDTVKITVLNVINVGDYETPVPVFKVYPNPTSGMITLEFTQNSGEKAEISVSNLDGAEVFRKVLGNATKHHLDLSNLKSGMYILKVLDNSHYTNKIVIEKE